MPDLLLHLLGILGLSSEAFGVLIGGVFMDPELVQKAGWGAHSPVHPLIPLAQYCRVQFPERGEVSMRPDIRPLNS